MHNFGILRNFIVIEGIDGAGTTTQLEKLGERLGSNNISCWMTCEPTDGPVGTLIRRVLRGDITVDPTTLAYLFVADRHEHLHAKKTGILGRLEDGAVVVCDRYIFSSLAYQSVDCGYEAIEGLNGFFPLPELLIYLDVPAELGNHRAANRQKREIFEYMDFQKSVIEFYERAINTYESSDMKIVRIDGSQSPEKVSENIWSHIKSLPID